MFNVMRNNVMGQVKKWKDNFASVTVIRGRESNFLKILQMKTLPTKRRRQGCFSSTCKKLSCLLQKGTKSRKIITEKCVNIQSLGK